MATNTSSSASVSVIIIMSLISYIICSIGYGNRDYNTHCDYVSSNEKDFLKSPGGHVALCISDSAHEKLWPKAAKWILSK